jgi:hypothetical protein
MVEILNGVPQLPNWAWLLILFSWAFCGYIFGASRELRHRKPEQPTRYQDWTEVRVFNLADAAVKPEDVEKLIVTLKGRTINPETQSEPYPQPRSCR